ncbi:MAG: CoA pyrophosphatase [Anaerolineae bacterium]|nr:CoA pyrophosphatase [Anaerolineae bacterium]
MLTSSLSLDAALNTIRIALSLRPFNSTAAWGRMVPAGRPLAPAEGEAGRARLAAVLILLYPSGDDLVFVLTRRTDSVATHKGQISLPGGAVEPDDRTLFEAALRETCEEIGFCEAHRVERLGSLTPLWVNVSDFVIHPFVGFVPERPTLTPDPAEVARVIEMSLSDLLDEGLKQIEPWMIRGLKLDIPFYNLNGDKVWGATAAILSEFEHRLRAVDTDGNR